MTSSRDPAPKRGRPRDPGADAAMLEAAMQLLVERGYADASIEQVAERAGIAKTTVYRRYRTKVDLFTAALAAHLEVDEPTPETGSLRGDLLAFLRNTPLDMFATHGAVMIGVFLAEKERHPELIETFRRRVLGPRRERLHEIFARAYDRGEITRDADPHLAMQALIGLLLARVLSGAPLDPGVLGRGLDMVLHGLPKPGAAR